MIDLKSLVTDRIAEIGVKDAAKLFGVSAGTASNWASGKTEPSIAAVQMLLAEANLESIGIFADVKTSPSDNIPLEQWEGKDVIVLLPVYRSFNADTHFTLFANYAKYGPDKIGLIQEKRTVIHESRNILIHKAMKTSANWFIFVDDDMLLPCGSPELFNDRYGAKINRMSAGFNAISRIMSHPKEKGIVGGLYFGRHPGGKAQCSSGFSTQMDNEKLHRGIYKGLKQEDWVGTGFMRIHRSVIEKYKFAIESGKFPECKPSSDQLWFGYFNPLRVGMGEDVSFCRRAAEIGIQSYVDTELVCLHTGETHFGPSNTKY